MRNSKFYFQERIQDFGNGWPEPMASAVAPVYVVVWVYGPQWGPRQRLNPLNPRMISQSMLAIIGKQILERSAWTVSGYQWQSLAKDCL